MNEESKNPIELVTGLLATMTARAVEAERQRDENKKSSDDWYQLYQTKDAELKEAQAKLSAEIEEHQNTRQALREALENVKKLKGAQNNGESD